jgi:DNA-3-methyladenine glycosylase
MSALPTRLERAFYARHTVEVARDLLGKVLVRAGPGGPVLSRVVETEAYHGHEDRASHASRGRTPRTAPMFGLAGLAYVYQIYGMYFCLNAVTGPVGFPSAVLIRAVEPLPGSTFGHRDGAGPGKLCRLLGVQRELNTTDLVAGEALWIGDDGLVVPPEAVLAGPRVGVDYAGDWAATPWRFWVGSSRTVSRGRAARRSAPDAPRQDPGAA